MGLRGRAIRAARPHSLVTLTQMGDDWVSARNNLNYVVARLKRRGYCWQHAYTVEPPEHHDHGARLHVHAWTIGDHVPHRVLDQVCWDVGVGHSHIEGITYDSTMTYGMKRALDDDTRADHLRLNSGRLGNHSRQFFRDRSGAPCSLGRRHGPPSSALASPTSTGAPSWQPLRRPRRLGRGVMAPHLHVAVGIGSVGEPWPLVIKRSIR